MLCAAGAAAQQRAEENAVHAAEDAFGVTIGRETLGLYTTSSVRGFSPTAAGNARIDGLYFDQVWDLNARLRRTVTIRVGPSAQSYPFPAPTGIVDYSFKTPGLEPSLSMLVAGDEWGGGSIEADAVLPPLWSDRVSIGLGAGVEKEEVADGTDGVYGNVGASVRWAPVPALEIVPFATRSEGRHNETAPIYVPAGSYLPPPVSPRQFTGPRWTDYDSTAVNSGLLLSYLPLPEWRVRLGVFRSRVSDRASFANLMLNLQPDGFAEQLIVAHPRIGTASTSGELRITRSMSEGERLHRVHVSMRARDRSRRYGGSDAIELGPTRLGAAATAPEPSFEFGPQTQDRISQQTVGIAYELHWAQRGELGVGLQRSSYDKRVERPGSSMTRTDDDPWLFNVTSAYALNDALTAYAGYTRGLEESDVAPEVASNRGEAVPAIRTRQADAGLRYALGPQLRLLAGVFEVTKPYYTLDAANRYAAFGDVAHRGLEVSLSGSPRSGLDVVAGAVFMEPEVTGPDVDSGAVGSRPVGQPRRMLRVDLDWRPRRLPNVSLDFAVRHIGRTPATRDNLVELPSRTVTDIGGRYRFTIGRAAATLRLSLANATDEYGYELEGSGAYAVMPGRRASAYVTVDW